MCWKPKAAAGSAADTRRVLIARLQPLQKLKPGSIPSPLLLLCCLLISSIMSQPENRFWHLKGNIFALLKREFRVHCAQLEIEGFFWCVDLG